MALRYSSWGCYRVADRPRSLWQYESDDYEWRDCNVIERNGSLVYVEDERTGDRQWIGRERLR